MEEKQLSIDSQARLGSYVTVLGEVLSAKTSERRRLVLGGAATVVAAVAALAWAGGAKAAGLGLLAILAAAIGFRRPALLAPLIALLLPAGEAAHVLGAQVAPLEAVVGGGALGYAARLAMRREELRVRAVDWVFAVLVLFIALSTFGPVRDSYRLRETLFWGALAVVFHALTTHLRERRNLRLFLFALAVSTIVEASLALYEYVDRWSERFSLLHGAIVYPLPRGTLGHPNALGQFFVIAVLAVLALALAERGFQRRAALAVVAAGSLALVVTFSRTSWIAFAVGCSVYLVDRRARRTGLRIGVVAAAVVVAAALIDSQGIGARISSLFRGDSGGIYDFRLQLMEHATDIVGAHPLTGSGQFQEAGIYAGRPDFATHPHNLFLGFAVFFGIPATLAFAALVVLALKAAWLGYRTRTDALRLTSLGLVAALVAFLVNGALEYPFWNTSLTVLVVLALASAVSLEPGRFHGIDLRASGDDPTKVRP